MIIKEEVVKKRLGVVLIKHTTTYPNGKVEILYIITFKSYTKQSFLIHRANEIYNTFINLARLYRSISKNIDNVNMLQYLIENTLADLDTISKENYIIVCNILKLCKKYRLDTDYIDTIKLRFEHYGF